jgi:mRNA interferase RelE/StbE
MTTAYKESFLRDLEKIRSAYALRGIRMFIRQMTAAQSLSDVQGLKPISQKDSHYVVEIGNYRVGLKIDHHAVVFVRAMHYRDVLREFYA